MSIRSKFRVITPAQVESDVRAQSMAKTSAPSHGISTPFFFGANPAAGQETLAGDEVACLDLILQVVVAAQLRVLPALLPQLALERLLVLQVLRVAGLLVLLPAVAMTSSTGTTIATEPGSSPSQPRLKSQSRVQPDADQPRDAAGAGQHRVQFVDCASRRRPGAPSSTISRLSVFDSLLVVGASENLKISAHSLS